MGFPFCSIGRAITLKLSLLFPGALGDPTNHDGTRLQRRLTDSGGCPANSRLLPTVITKTLKSSFNCFKRGI